MGCRITMVLKICILPCLYAFSNKEKYVFVFSFRLEIVIPEQKSIFFFYCKQKNIYVSSSDYLPEIFSLFLLALFFSMVHVFISIIDNNHLHPFRIATRFFHSREFNEELGFLNLSIDNIL